jgi:MFS family permease
MFLSVLRSISSIIAGLIAALAVLIATEVFSTIFHPPPPGLDMSDMAACREHVARYPTWVLAACAVGWAAAPFAGSWLATRLGTRRHWAHGIIVGGILLAMAGFNMYMLPYPLWFPAVILVTFPLGTFLGTRLGRGSPSLPKQM